MSERVQCTKDNPWNGTNLGPVVHHDTREVGDQTDGYPGGDIVTRQCLNCGHEWEQELPQ